MRTPGIGRETGNRGVILLAGDVVRLIVLCRDEQSAMRMALWASYLDRTYACGP